MLINLGRLEDFWTSSRRISKFSGHGGESCVVEFEIVVLLAMEKIKAKDCRRRIENEKVIWIVELHACVFLREEREMCYI